MPGSPEESRQHGLKICKACEPCRRRKIRCDGGQPCSQPLCRKTPTRCTYRAKARRRRSRLSREAPLDSVSAASTVLSDVTLIDHSTSTASVDPQQRVAGRDPYPHASIVASHEAPGSTDSSQLFYGPSSNFAFSQQLYRAILLETARARRGGSDVEEGGPGLDMFMQRSTFFGMPQRVKPDAVLPSFSMLGEHIPLERLDHFLHTFKQGYLDIYSFLTNAELDRISRYLHNEGGERASLLPQKKAVILAILAVGALLTPYTDQAEYLYALAKREAAPYDEAVTLPMIQFSVLLSGYQLNMGRPNSSYIHLGTASRNAFSMGLHRDVTSHATENNQDRQATIWCLFFHESWTALALGRKAAIKITDISCPFPENQPVLNALCQLVRVVESVTDVIYSQQCDSLRKLYIASDTTHGQLRDFANRFSVASATSFKPSPYGDVASLLLHAFYYHAVLLTFRPFLVATAAMSPHSRQTEGMWLRQACRHAVDTAQDSITYISNTICTSPPGDVCRAVRYTGFFLETNCTVLLYDSLWFPSKHPHHLEYVQDALKCLDAMIHDEPMTLCRTSIQQILEAVERAIAHKTNVSSGDSTPGSTLQWHRTNPNSFNQHLYLTDLWDQNTAQGSSSVAIADQDLHDFNLDIMTTDLLHFFAPDTRPSQSESTG